MQATTKTKTTFEVQASFKCDNCGVEVVTTSYMLVVPIKCGNCDHAVFTRQWAQKLLTHTTISPL